MIRVGSKEEIDRAVNRYLDRILIQKRSLQQHHIAVIELVGALSRFASNNHIVVDELQTNIKDLYGHLLDMEEDALRRWFVDICLLMHEKLMVARSRSSESIILKAQEYVRDHYGDESLALDDVCGALGVSNSYFSTIFKKTTGKSFVAYLTDYRMELAAQMLIETDEKSYIVAKSVGYTDANYFSYVFKRRFGVSPSKYRTENAESEKKVCE
jgi:two-component system response regulator YesN